MNFPLFCPRGDLKLHKSTLSQHFKILREAGLIRSERKGVELYATLHHSNEGSIPFTRSIDNQRLAKQCSKSAVNSNSSAYFCAILIFYDF
jgi:DNA-binding transcriptional ArsR family regulator